MQQEDQAHQGYYDRLFDETRALGVNANIMSLGGIAIAIGAMIDAAIVMIENMHKHVERHPERPRWEVVVQSTREVGPALFISLAFTHVAPRWPSPFSRSGSCWPWLGRAPWA